MMRFNFKKWIAGGLVVMGASIAWSHPITKREVVLVIPTRSPGISTFGQKAVQKEILKQLDRLQFEPYVYEITQADLDGALTFNAEKSQKEIASAKVLLQDGKKIYYENVDLPAAAKKFAAAVALFERNLDESVKTDLIDAQSFLILTDLALDHSQSAEKSYQSLMTLYPDWVFPKEIASPRLEALAAKVGVKTATEKGTISVKTDMDSVKIVLNGDYQGMARKAKPLLMRVPVKSNAVIHAYRDGYLDAVKILSFQKDDESVTVNLDPADWFQVVRVFSDESAFTERKAVLNQMLLNLYSHKHFHHVVILRLVNRSNAYGLDYQAMEWNGAELVYKAPVHMDLGTSLKKIDSTLKGFGI